MATSKLMPSSTTSQRNSDLRKKSSASTTAGAAASSSSTPYIPPTASSSAKSDLQSCNHRSGSYGHCCGEAAVGGLEASPNSMSVDGLLRNVYGESQVAESTLLTADITLLDAAGAIAPIADVEATTTNLSVTPPQALRKTVDDVWREIVEGKREQRKPECKEESMPEMMTLEEYLVNVGAVDESAVTASEPEVKLEAGAERLSGGIFAFDSPLVGSSSYIGTSQVVDGMVGYGNGIEMIGGGRGKRKTILEPMDKAAAQRQRRMIKNRESAARSRERKQAYQVELESMAVRLEEENELLLKEKAERTKDRLKQLMEKVIPIVEKRRPPRMLRRIRSMEW